MVRNTMTLVFALAACLVAGSTVRADDKVPTKSGFSGGAIGAATTTLAGAGTATAAARANDTELTWYHRYYRGYRAGFYNGWYGGFGAPFVYPYPYVGFYSPYVIPPIVSFQVGPFGMGIGINGSAGDVATPALSLNRSGFNGGILRSLMPSATPAQPSGVYPYDGGPAKPIPLSKPDGAPNDQASPQLPPTPGLPVSLPKTPAPAKPYAYKGYGEK